MLLAIIYSVSPLALSAPDNRTVTTKADWEKGDITNIQTYGTSTNADAIQLKGSGSWTARVWANPPDTISMGHSSCVAGDYLYVFRGYSDKTFWRYNTIENSWESLPDLPMPAYYGADMSYDGDGNIYMIFGGFSKKFYKYNIDEEEYTELLELPDTPWYGAGIESDGTNMYVIRGNGTRNFWKYNEGENEGVSDDGWDILPAAPANVGRGASLVNNPSDGHFYLAAGNNTRNFYSYHYDAATPHWEAALAVMPVSNEFNGETKGVYYNGYVYFLRSTGTATFLRYKVADPGGNTWEIMASDAAPFVTQDTSLAFDPNDNKIFAFRSNGQYDFWKFDPAQAAGFRWVGPKQVNGGSNVVNTGGDLIYNSTSDILYATIGSSTAFYAYNPVADSWTGKAVLPASAGIDMKGTFCSTNNLIYHLQGASPYTAFYTYSENAWSTLTTQPFPAAAGQGAGLACASNGTVYAIRGGNTPTFYSYTLAGGWVTALPTMVVDGVTYNANVGARIVAVGTDIYVMPGGGETTFLKFSGGAWSKVTSTPFAQYYGTDMTYNSNKGKIYALAGYYKNETWEYDPNLGAGGTWRRLPNNQKLIYGRGPYSGASIESAGNSRLFATTGQGSADMWSYTIGSTNYPDYDVLVPSSQGTYISEVMDLSQVASWINLTATHDKPANTDIIYQTRSSADNETWSSWADVSGTYPNYTVSASTPAARYFQVQIILRSDDGVATPTVYDYTISYNSEETDPTNPTVITAKNQQIGGTDISPAPASYAYDHPYFTWPAPGVAGGAGDSGSGVDGYYVCFASDADCDDPEQDGTYQTSNYYSANETLSAGEYHLKIKTKDEKGNTTDDTWDAFTYKYDGVSPPDSKVRTSQADFQAGTVDGISTSGVPDSMRLNSVSGFWNQSRLNFAPGTVGNGAEMALAKCRGNNNHCLYTFSAGNNAVFYRYEIETNTWTSSPATLAAALGPVYYGAQLVAGPTGYLYATPGTATSTFWRYDIENNTWATAEGGSAPNPFNYGSTLTYDGDEHIYATFGSDDIFYKYNTSTGNWQDRALTQFGNPNTSDGQIVSEGADAVFDGRNNVYMSQGNYYPYFGKYSIAADGSHGETENTWTVLAQAPEGFYDGGSLVYDSEKEVIYAVSGKSRQKFYKYEIASNTWTAMPNVPAGLSYGTSLKIYDGYIYATRGGTNGFYRFSLENNSWEIPQFGIFGPQYLGTSSFNFYNGTFMTGDDDDELYIIRGYYDNTFSKYNAQTGEVTELARLPIGAYSGASIQYVGDRNEIYYVPGDVPTRRAGANNYFFKYDIATNTWSEPANRPVIQATDGSSMTFDGSQYLYLTQGANTAVWWRYDTHAGTWSAALPTIANWIQGTGAKIVYSDGYIYSMRAGADARSWRYKIDAPSAGWALLGNLPAAPTTGATLTDGGDGYIYAIRGGDVNPNPPNPNTYYRYNKSQTAPGTWETISGASSIVPAQVYNGGISVNMSNRNWLIAGNGSVNTFRDGLYSYTVGSATNGTGFERTGTYESDAIDLTGVDLNSAYHFANLTLKYSQPDNTFTQVETQTSLNGSDWSSWSQVSNEHVFGAASVKTHVFNINSAPSRYIKVKITFSSSDQVFSPQLDEFTVNYYQDSEEPTNPTSISAYKSPTDLTPITSDTWYKNATPYFTWPAEGAAGGAVDNEGGSGVAGYWVCFGIAADCVDPYIDGVFQEGTTFSATGLVSGETYYLKIKAVDNAGRIPAGSFAAFTYKYDATPPNIPSDISVTPTGYTSIDNFAFLWESDANDVHSGIKILQYRTENDVDAENNELWTDILDPTTVNVTIPNADHPVGAYQSRANLFQLRVVDNADNVSSPLPQEFFFSATAPSPPQNLRTDNEYSSTNSFSFFWETPSSYVGDPSKIKYYYSINAEPTRYNTVETEAKAVGPAAFATQKGTNTFYVVAKDEAGNIDWKNFASKEFTADTSNPPVPGNVQAFDTSDRESQEYSVAVKWSTPSGIDTSNFAGYAIFRSEDNVTFTEVAMTTGSAFVDTGIESKLYYYYVKSKDKTNNYSAVSSTVSLTPTGRYTSAPKVVQDPSTIIQSFQATFNWATNRVCSSFVEYGETIKLGNTTGQVDSLTDHEVITKGLKAGTKYFYRVKFIDPDGNIGTSEIDNFTTLPPPTISEFTISDVGLSSATVSYKTNTGGTCILKYGKGAYTTTNEETASSTSHVTKIESLESSTTYNAMADCLDGDGNSFSSDEYTFTTLRQPVVSEPQVENKENVDIPTVDIFYKTDEPTTTLIKFKSADEGSFHNYLTNDSVTEHKATIEGLEPAKEYEMILSGMSGSGVEALAQTIKVTTRSDSRPPEIATNRAIGKVNGRGQDAQATIYIKVETNEMTTIKINFNRGVVVSGFEQNTPEDASNTYHLVTIPVEAGQVYSYQVEAYDSAKNKTLSKPSTIVVEDKKQNAAEIVTNTFSTQFGWLGSVFKKK